MKKEHSERSIYRKIVGEIYAEKLQPGDRLPAVGVMSQQYGVRPGTVLAVYKRLAEAGFVSTAKGRAPVVISDCGSTQEALQQFCQWAAEFVDNFRLIQLLLPSAVYQSIQLFEQADIRELEEIIEALGASREDVMRFRECKGRFVQKLFSKTPNASLARYCSDAQARVILPRTMPGSYSQADKLLGPFRQYYIERVGQFPAMIAAGQYEAVKRALREIYCRISLEICGVVRELAAAGQMDKQAEPNMEWERIDPEGLIVADVIQRILDGTLQNGEFLISEHAASSLYQVAAVTVRRAKRMLNELGIVQTINGRGTRVALFLGAQTLDAAGRAEMTRRMEACFEALRMICALAQDFSETVVDGLDERAACEMAARLRRKWDQPKGRRSYTGMALVTALVEAAECHTIREYYAEVNKALVAQLFLERYAEDWEEKTGEFHRRCLQALEQLERRQAKEFGRTVTGILGDKYHYLYSVYLRFQGENREPKRCLEG